MNALQHLSKLLKDQNRALSQYQLSVLIDRALEMEKQEQLSIGKLVIVKECEERGTPSTHMNSIS